MTQAQGHEKSERDCFHYRDGVCRLRFFDSNPTVDDCLGCKRYVGKPRGLGDTITRLASATGIDRVVGKWEDQTGKDCGCQKRRKKLNKVLPYKREGS